MMVIQGEITGVISRPQPARFITFTSTNAGTYTGGASTFTFVPNDRALVEAIINGGFTTAQTAPTSEINETILTIGGQDITVIDSLGQHTVGFSIQVNPVGSITINIPSGSRPADTDTRVGVLMRWRNNAYTTNNPVTQEVVYPADRCHWQITPVGSGNGYEIHDAFFYSGAATTGEPIAHPAFGYIGKSGRFVAITEAS